MSATLALATLGGSIGSAPADLGNGATIVLVVGLAAGLLLWVVEMFMPHGVAATIGTVCLAAAVWAIFAIYGSTSGVAAVACVGIVVASLAMVAARRITSKHRQDERYTVAGPQRMALVGKRARAVSALRPGGVVAIGADGDGERVDAITRGEWLAPGTEVDVVGVEVSFVVVKPVAPPVV